MLDAITPRTKLAFLCLPNNPTGTTNTRAELDAWFDAVPEHVLTVIDQAYFEYIDDPDYPDAIAEYAKRGRRVLVLRTFSKIYGLAGLRVGYGDRPRRRSSRRSARSGGPSTSRRQAQAAALASIGNDAEIARRRAGERARGACSSRRSSAAQASTRRGRRSANFVYAEVGSDSRPFFEQLLRAGRDRAAAARLRRPGRSADHGRDGRGARVPRRGRSSEWALPPRRDSGPRRGSRQLALLRRRPGLPLLFFATLESGLGTWLAVIALHGRRVRPHRLRQVGRRAPGRELPPLRRRRAAPRPAPRPPLPARRDGRVPTSPACGVFCALPFTSTARLDRRARRGRRPRDRLLHAGRLRGAAEPRRDADLPRELALPLDGLPRRARSAPLVGGILVAAAGPNLGLRAQRSELPRLRAADRADPRAAAPERARPEPRPLARPRATAFGSSLRSRPLLTVLVAWSIAASGTRAINVAEVVLAKDTFDSGTFGFGLLAAGSGLGPRAGQPRRRNAARARRISTSTASPSR